MKLSGSFNGLTIFSGKVAENKDIDVSVNPKWRNAKSHVRELCYNFFRYSSKFSLFSSWSPQVGQIIHLSVISKQLKIE